MAFDGDETAPSALAFAKERYDGAAIRGRANDARPKSAEIATKDFLPIVQSAELPAKNGERLCVALGDWMEALALIQDGHAHKGDVLATAHLAAVMAAKRTHEWIPLAHPVPLEAIDVSFALDPEGPCVDIETRVRTRGRTGVEMEALTAVSAAALTLYDMLKAVDRGMVIGEIALWEKRGGRSGTWRRSTAVPTSRTRPAARRPRSGMRRRG